MHWNVWRKAATSCAASSHWYCNKTKRKVKSVAVPDVCSLSILVALPQKSMHLSRADDVTFDDEAIDDEALAQPHQAWLIGLTGKSGSAVLARNVSEPASSTCTSQHLHHSS